MDRRTRTRLTLGSERGMTLVELVVAMTLLATVLLVFTSTLASVQKVVVAEQARGEINNQARLALQTIDRLVRSGNLLYDPASELGNDPYDATSTGLLFRVYTQAKQQPDDDPRCALWLVDDEQQLKYREWPPLQPENATGWRVVSTDVVNRTLDRPAFVTDPDGRTINVQFLVNPNLSKDANATQEFEAAITGRNTSFGYPNDVCSDLPSLT